MFSRLEIAYMKVGAAKRAGELRRQEEKP